MNNIANTKKDIAESNNAWKQVLSRVESKVNRHSFYTWFRPTSFSSDEGHSLRVRVPNNLFRNWLTKHYSGVIKEALAEINQPDTEVV